LRVAVTKEVRMSHAFRAPSGRARSRVRLDRVATGCAAVLMLLCGLVPAALAAAVHGIVLDSSSKPIADAQVTVIELKRSMLTSADGAYAFTNLPAGSYRVAVQRLGFAPAVQAVAVTDAGAALDFVLKTSYVEVPTVQVTASAHATSALTSPQPVSQLEGEALRVARSASLGETVSSLAGIRSWSTGGSIGKPVIRGLRSDRVLVLNDGQRLENQQWGDEHGPQVDVEDSKTIEVIRGPSSVLYGSDALGGVVNVITPELPTAFGEPAFVKVGASARFESVADAGTGHFSFEGAKEGLGFRGFVSGRTASDLRTPPEKLFNSGGNDFTCGGTVGTRGSWGAVEGSYTRRDERIEIHEDPAEDPTATGYQRIGDDLAHLKAQFPTGSESRLELSGSFEQNRRREFEDADATDVALGLLSRSYNGEVRFNHPALGKVSGVVGGSYFYNRFDKFGEETLIPNTNTRNGALFVFEQADIDRWHLSGGVRFDTRRLEVPEDDAEIGVASQERSWTAFTGNLGVLYRLADPLALAFNVGRGFRAPSSFDLFAKGVHEGTVAFEVGSPDLTTESSLNTDLALRVQSSRVRTEVGGYVNTIQNYIYTRPTGTFDPGSGFEIFETVQGDARFTGGETQVEWHVTPKVHLSGSADYVQGTNTSTDTPLPWVPPFRGTYGVRFEGSRVGALDEPYVSVSAESNAGQDRLDPLDTTVGAYTLAHAAAGFTVPLSGRSLAIDLAVRNLFDTDHHDFMSRYKTYASAPGRNFTLRVGMPI
jgi:iron complex outermembrane receptor protein